MMVSQFVSGFGGLVDSMLASSNRVRGFKPGRKRRNFSGEKVLSMPSFEREVKPFAPCRRFAACLKIPGFTWKLEPQAKFVGNFSPNSFLR
jgi:hypothetical protein